ncbi:MAG: hypothetical protein ACYTE8_08845 [Planctomycetota bacterium]|jgi:hypothetical protein
MTVEKAHQFKRNVYIFILFFIFMSICFGFGYASFNRYDLRKTAVTDSIHYYEMALFDYENVEAPFRYRPMIPTLAGILYKTTISRLNFGSWEPVFFSFTIVNSIFISLTCFLLISITRALKFSNTAATLAPFLYLSSYAIVNYHTTGLVDAGEAFFLTAVMLALLKEKWFFIPIIITVGTWAKEGIAAFGLVYTVAWWLFNHFRKVKMPRISLVYICLAVILAVCSLLLIYQLIISGETYEKHTFSMVRIYRIPLIIFSPAYLKETCYPLLFLLPVGLIRLRRIPLSFTVASLITALAVIIIAAYVEATRGRALFNVLAPLLSVSCAVFLSDILCPDPHRINVESVCNEDQYK